MNAFSMRGTDPSPAWKNRIVEILSGGLLEPETTHTECRRFLAPDGAAVLLHRNYAGTVQSVLTGPGTQDVEGLIETWNTARLEPPSASGSGLEGPDPPVRWCLWRRPGLLAMSFAAGQHGPQLGVLLLRGIGGEDADGLERDAASLATTFSRHAWRSWNETETRRLMDAATSAMVRGGPDRLVALLQGFTRAEAVLLVHHRDSEDDFGYLAQAWSRSLPSRERSQQREALRDASPAGGLGRAWLTLPRETVGTLPELDGKPFLLLGVAQVEDRELALLILGAPQDPSHRPALDRVAQLLASTFKLLEATNRREGRATGLFKDRPHPKGPDIDEFVVAWRTLQARLTHQDPADDTLERGLRRFARDVAASFGQQGELARVLGVESQTVRRHIVTIVPELRPPPWRQLAERGSVLPIKTLTAEARRLTQDL